MLVLLQFFDVYNILGKELSKAFKHVLSKACLNEKIQKIGMRLECEKG